MFFTFAVSVNIKEAQIWLHLEVRKVKRGREVFLTSSGNMQKAFKFFFFLIYLFLFLAALGLRCCVLAFSSCGEQGLLFVAVRRLLIAVASLVVEHRL